MESATSLLTQPSRKGVHNERLLHLWVRNAITESVAEPESDKSTWTVPETKKLCGNLGAMHMYSSDIDCSCLMKQGAEAKIFTGTYLGRPCIIKERFSKKYRHPSLDNSLTQQRTKSEVRSMMRCRSHGIKTPAVYFVDLDSNKIYMEHIEDGITVRDHVTNVLSTGENVHGKLKPLLYKMGEILGNMHRKNIIHGDLTTSNMLIRSPPENLEIVLIDFGLGYIDNLAEDKGVDLYVLERAFLSTHPNTEDLFQVLLEGYIESYGSESREVIDKLEEVRLRGRKRTMVG